MVYERFWRQTFTVSRARQWFIIDLGLWDVASTSTHFCLRVFYPSSIDTLSFIASSAFGGGGNSSALVNDNILPPLLPLGRIPLPRCPGPRVRRTSYLPTRLGKGNYLSRLSLGRHLRQRCRTSENRRRSS